MIKLRVWKVMRLSLEGDEVESLGVRRWKVWRVMRWRV